MVDPAGQRFRTHQTTLPPSRRGCHPQVLASCSTTSRPGPPPRGEPSDRWGRRPPPVATASRCPGRTAGRPPAWSPTAQVAAPPAGTGDGQRRGPGHPGTSGRWAGTTGSPTAPRTADTAGWAQHNTRLVAGQLLEGWWATLVNIAAQDASIARSPDRSQITATGRSAKRLSSALRREGTAARSSSPSGPGWHIHRGCTGQSARHIPWPFGTPQLTTAQSRKHAHRRWVHYRVVVGKPNTRLYGPSATGLPPRSSSSGERAGARPRRSPWTGP